MKKKQSADARKRRWRFGGYTGGKLRALIVCAFAVVYVLGMLLATWIDQTGRTREYGERVERMLTFVSGEIEKDNGSSMERILSRLADYYSYEENQMVSFAVYNADGILQTKNENVFYYEYREKENSERQAVDWKLEDYLAEEEIAQLAEYAVSVKDGGHPKYYIEAEKAGDGEDLAAIYVKRLFNSTDERKSAEDSEYEWSWVNPDLSTENEEESINDPADVQDGMIGPVGNVAVYFPGITQGLDVWREWNDSDYLQDFPMDYQDDPSTYHDPVIMEDFVTYRTSATPIYLNERPNYLEPEFSLVVRSVEHPWRAAVNSLNRIYLWGGILTAACVLLVLSIVEATFRKRARMEEQQRDFTNAIAHEMKTPLAVIRGFAENLEENANEEKRKYYLDQIIGQTEQMDGMVKEMVFLSRLDSGEYRPVKEPVSVRELIGELQSAYDTQIEEKRIEVRISCGEDFVISGDKRFLEKAFGNLIANAVDHNRYEGKISIDIEKNRCVIENTGEKISPEDLPRVCELFYTGDKSRGGQEKHLGVGLYLADRIFRAHKMKLKIANTEDGVRVTVEI